MVIPQGNTVTAQYSLSPMPQHGIDLQRSLIWETIYFSKSSLMITTDLGGMSSAYSPWS
ncbi:hypothetical protein BH23CHL2_BH23CHL2_05820 [soil metagenome]